MTTPRLQLITAFLLGSISTLLLVSVLNPHLNLLQSSSSCAISFGSYHGPQYRTDQTVGASTCLVESKFLKLQQHGVRLEGSSEVIADWLWVDYHDRINVLAQAPDSTPETPTFLVFEQTKYALEGRTSLAIVGGIIEPGEGPEQAAKREVEEELQVVCEHWCFLGRYRTDVNRGVGWTNTYLASQCHPAKQQQQHEAKQYEVGVADTERQDVKTLTKSELEEAVSAGKFLEIQWTATISLALLHLEQEDHNHH